MIKINIIKSFVIVILYLLFLSSCSNTRVLVEGTKKILDKSNSSNDFAEKDKTNIKIGHYKVGNPYNINGITYTPKLISNYDKIGIASWYGPKFDKKLTANGEIFNQNLISGAHKTLPLPSIVKVTNLSNKRFIYIRLNDRGPFVNDRIIDLSKEAAIRLNFYDEGVTEVRVELIDTGPHLLEKKYLNQYDLTEYASSIENKKIINKNKNSFLLQVGAFSEIKNANELMNYLKTIINDNLFIKNYKEKSESFIYKVFVGPFDKEAEAKEAAAELQSLGYNIIYKENKR